MGKTLQVQHAVKYVVEVATSLAVYLPVLAGIITPMIWILPLWYFSWDLLAPILPFSQNMEGILLFRVIIPEGAAYYLSVCITTAVMGCLVAGSVLFLWALREMVIRRAHGGGLVTTGPYRLVRHPQHLGISLILLGVAILTFSASGFPINAIRIGNIVSWMFVTFVLIAVADMEEVHLTSQFEEDYERYREQTAFIIPRMKPMVHINQPHFEQGRPLRYVLGFLEFWVLASLLLWGASFFPLITVR